MRLRRGRAEKWAAHQGRLTEEASAALLSAAVDGDTLAISPSALRAAAARSCCATASPALCCLPGSGSPGTARRLAISVLMGRTTMRSVAAEASMCILGWQLLGCVDFCVRLAQQEN